MHIYYENATILFGVFYNRLILNLTKKITFIVTEWFYMKSIKFIRKDYIFFFFRQRSFLWSCEIKEKDGGSEAWLHLETGSLCMAGSH